MYIKRFVDVHDLHGVLWFLGACVHVHTIKLILDLNVLLQVFSRNEDGLGDKLRLLHIKPYKIRLHTIRHPTKETLYSSGSLSFQASDLRVLFKVRHKTELSYSEAIRGNEICECTLCQLAGLLNLMVASGTGIRESCGLPAPLLLFGESIN
ncbi:hypothetical protein CEXT_613761 [Caerostris extrusa]|uniref:Uncharacterized protein n=1 Tax=Caerostris extrusa TaxID=172846 RepID=A0AAV4XW86_CAEEX|nr:hypothetical protein CEXT_613761 [Caerostris extrusa]